MSGAEVVFVVLFALWCTGNLWMDWRKHTAKVRQDREWAALYEKDAETYERLLQEIQAQREIIGAVNPVVTKEFASLMRSQLDRLSREDRRMS